MNERQKKKRSRSATTFCSCLLPKNFKTNENWPMKGEKKAQHKQANNYNGSYITLYEKCLKHTHSTCSEFGVFSLLFFNGNDVDG